MKKQLFCLILVGFSLITTFAIAQNSNLPTKKINGIEYYVYSVEASEGLNAIARKFNVLPEDISKANPEVKNGLRIDQKILIPVLNKKLQSGNDDSINSNEFIQYKVKKKQTLFAISRKYNISQEEIKRLNPQVEKGLREDMILQIPVLNKKPINKTDENLGTKKIENYSDNYSIHIVQEKETLYSISKLYNVEIDNIRALNPNIGTTISIGSAIKIPTNSTNKKSDTTTQKIKSLIDLSTVFDKSSQTISSNKKSIRIAFLLPFMLEQQGTDSGADRFVNFYAGSLIAIKEAKEKGVSLEIFTYDTDKTEEKINEILNKAELKSMDLIIGPAFSNQVSAMSSFAQRNEINTLIPFTSKIPNIENNPFLYQFNPGFESELKFATELFLNKYKNANLIFANIPDISNFDNEKIWSEKLKNNLTSNNRSFTTVELTSLDSTVFSSILKKNRKNLIIFNTGKFAYASPYITSLNSLSSLFDITIFEQYTWKEQSGQLTERIYISPFISTFNPSSYANFNKKFSNNFNWNSSSDNPRYDLLGYDLANYFITLLTKYGNKLPVKLFSPVNAKFIQSQPVFERISPKSGFINQQLYLSEDKKM